MGLMSRFWLSFLAVCAYMALWALPILAAAVFLDEDVIVFVILLIAVLIFLSMPFFIDWCAKHIFYFKAEGTPIAEADLRHEILAINVHDVPIVVTEDGGKLLVTWKYLDAKWWEIMSKQGVRESFKVTLRFDSRRHRVTMVDSLGKIRWGAGPTKVRLSWSFFRGVYLNYRIGAAWGIRENFTLGKIYSFTFDSGEIHNPVMNTILRSGWDVRFSVF